jgi:hypothetical protein
MSAVKKKKGASEERSAKTAGKGRLPYSSIILGSAVLAVAVGLMLFARGEAEPEPVAVSAPERPADRTGSAPKRTDDFQRLLGRWMRPDGGYVIEIRGISPDGIMEAAYLNPRPINVSKAQAYRKEGVPQVLIELRDEGYPGSTYTLTYDPRQDALAGIYFQAALEQAFEVVFIRAE